ncbi:hypothetical protein PISMIDRAFT_684507 [Pisolithus microcarpus 441]|uniref:Uncharacterized protein n=1 Tax=Pisolithus microcarpus 441 TaxID=765257 RepID=A0A0C9YN89_9AGAM|nr:hypothetical protein PISMIDRAFT_684507 [Pisolithus microcarpus 441]
MRWLSPLKPTRLAYQCRYPEGVIWACDCTPLLGILCAPRPSWKWPEGVIWARGM